MIQIKQNHNSYNIGMDEIVDLKEAMTEVLKPIQQALKENIYWTDVSIEPTEYKSRDGFIPYSHNCGGLELSVIIPDCESYNFSYLEFGEWDGEHYCDKTDTDSCECAYSQDGEYDAKLRIWFKFEGIEDKKLKFWLYMGGGNGDAPYFRTKYESAIFESSFECSSVSGVKRAATKSIKALSKTITKG